MSVSLILTTCIIQTMMWLLSQIASEILGNNSFFESHSVLNWLNSSKNHAVPCKPHLSPIVLGDGRDASNHHLMSQITCGISILVFCSMFLPYPAGCNRSYLPPRSYSEDTARYIRLSIVSIFTQLNL